MHKTTVFRLIAGPTNPHGVFTPTTGYISGDFPGLALIHNGPAWDISHIRSGLGVVYGLTKADAIALATHAARHYDWTQTGAALRADIHAVTAALGAARAACDTRYTTPPSSPTGATP